MSRPGAAAFAARAVHAPGKTAAARMSRFASRVRNHNSRSEICVDSMLIYKMHEHAKAVCGGNVQPFASVIARQDVILAAVQLLCALELGTSLAWLVAFAHPLAFDSFTSIHCVRVAMIIASFGTFAAIIVDGMRLQRPSFHATALAAKLPMSSSTTRISSLQRMLCAGGRPASACCLSWQVVFTYPCQLEVVATNRPTAQNPHWKPCCNATFRINAHGPVYLCHGLNCCHQLVPLAPQVELVPTRFHASRDHLTALHHLFSTAGLMATCKQTHLHNRHLHRNSSTTHST